MELYYKSFSETGLGRKENEDAIFCAENGGAGIFLVADGMGGHTDGARASGIIRDRIKIWWDRFLIYKKKPVFFQVVEEIRAVVEDANQEIFENTKKGKICGSTVVLLWIQESAWAVFSCGDSRCYQVRKHIITGHVCQLTTDDVWENQQQNVYGMSEVEIQNHAYFGCLIHAVGAKVNCSCSVQTNQLKGRMVFALCSDGIYRFCPEKYMKKQLKRAINIEKVEDCTEKIKAQVYQNKAPDNLSLIVVSISV